MLAINGHPRLLDSAKILGLNIISLLQLKVGFKRQKQLWQQYVELASFEPIR